MSYTTDVKNDTVMVEDSTQLPTKDDGNLDWLASQATEEEHNLTLLQGLKKYPKACFWSIALSSAIIMEGYDIVLIYSLFGQPAFQRTFGQYDAATGTYSLSAAWQAGLSNGTGIGTIIGAFLNGYLTHKFGYRKVMMMSLAAMVAFIFIPFFSPNLPVLLVGQILCGIPWGVFATMAPAYASEICPTALRAYLTVYVNLTWAFGQLVAAGVMVGFSDGTSKWAYKIPFAIQWAWPIPIAVLVFFAPESPWHLVRKGQLDAAERVITRISSSGTAEDHKKTVAMLVHTNKTEIEIETGTSYLDCFKRSDLRRTEIVCMVRPVVCARFRCPMLTTICRLSLLSLSAAAPWAVLLLTSSFKPGFLQVSLSKCQLAASDSLPLVRSSRGSSFILLAVAHCTSGDLACSRPFSSSLVSSVSAPVTLLVATTHKPR